MLGTDKIKRGTAEVSKGCSRRMDHGCPLGDEQIGFVFRWSVVSDFQGDAPGCKSLMGYLMDGIKQRVRNIYYRTTFSLILLIRIHAFIEIR